MTFPPEEGLHDRVSAIILASAKLKTSRTDILERTTLISSWMAKRGASGNLAKGPSKKGGVPQSKGGGQWDILAENFGTKL